MGQEPTTVAASEPALSFEFDSSQSLFEQLTKAQQASNSTFPGIEAEYSGPPSPVQRVVEAMPPPQVIPQLLPPVSEEMVTPMVQYPQVPMPSTVAQQLGRRESDYGVMYDRNGMPFRTPQRHASMPAYMEYSPAPSFVSSHYEDYSNRGVSYEPVTPPQQGQMMPSEAAYITHEEAGMYGPMPEMNVSQGYHPMMQMAPTSASQAQYSGNQRAYQPSNAYNVIDGSPTYKQRRRRSSVASTGLPVPPSQPGMPHAPHRASDLRRSISVTVPAVPEIHEDDEDVSPQTIPTTYQHQLNQQMELLEHLSRHNSPMPPSEHNVRHLGAGALHPSEEYPSYLHEEMTAQSLNPSPTNRVAGPIRRARSATMGELGPYPQKSHSCPIPTCGRLFKRLEHLKRYVSNLPSL